MKLSIISIIISFLHLFSGISLTQVLQFSLGPISRSLANTDGSIYRFLKFKLLQYVETEISIVGSIPFNTTVIYDGICVIRQLPKVFQLSAPFLNF